MVEFEAFAADCRIHGLVDVGDRRMTDMLNAASELRLGETRLMSLEDGHLVELPELTVDRDELCAVVAHGPRGDEARRVRTHATRVEVDLGPYHVEGAIHGTPASDPLASVLRRAAWVPLTDATLRYQAGPDVVSQDLATLIINRGLASSFRPAEEASTLLPWETPRPSARTTRRTVDLTGTLRDEDRPDPDEPAAPQAMEPPI